MKFEEIKVEFKKYATLDVIAESETIPEQTTYSNEGANDPYENDKF